MKTGINIGNCAGPTPGSTRAVSQRKAINMGYEAPVSERKVDPMMAGKDGKTGGTSAPGLTSKATPRRM